MNCIAKLCEVCSKLDLRHLVHPLHSCCEPLPCRNPPSDDLRAGSYLSLGSVDEIKRRRSTCDVCKLVAECLDKEPSDLTGECRIKESTEFCTFTIPAKVKRNPRVTHFHLRQAIVIFDTSKADRFLGPMLPWEAKEKDNQSTHYILKFQVAAGFRIKLGDSTLKTEENILTTIGGRYVTTQVDCRLIRAWLHQCENEHHTDCMPSPMLPKDRGMLAEPTFVIDVTQSCLVNTPSQCRYVALSYVWGTARVFMHLKENTRDLRRTGSLYSLPIPATIQDSVTLVRSIGERYLWVDSICIIQDDLTMKQTEISHMGSIYSKALFTIIAAAGDHADSGLPGVRPGSRERVQKVLKLADCELLTVIDIHRTSGGIDDTVWAQRAWTFQERVLSKRVLVFSDSQVYWGCRAASYSEERALEQVRDIRRLHLAFPQGHTGDHVPQEPLEPMKYSIVYGGLLSTYRQRRLTHNTDLLNAFHGISEVLATSQNDTFLWGLPESLFTYAMTWSFTGHSARNYVEVPILEGIGSVRMVPFPSWSWAAWSGGDPSNLPYLHSGDRAVQAITHFYIMDKGQQLVRIRERLRVNYTGGSVCASWQKHEPPRHPSLVPRLVLPQVGQLYFWTSFANVRAIRTSKFVGQRQTQYILFPPSMSQPGPELELVYQDFIVIAARNIDKMLILLAIEWRNGVAYRIGEADVWEEEWACVENREWRLVVLG